MQCVAKNVAPDWSQQARATMDGVVERPVRPKTALTPQPLSQDWERGETPLLGKVSVVKGTARIGADRSLPVDALTTRHSRVPIPRHGALAAFADVSVSLASRQGNPGSTAPLASSPCRQRGMAVGRGPAQGARPLRIPSTAISRCPALTPGSPLAATPPKSLGRGHYSRLHREPGDTPTGPRTTAVPPPVPQAWPSARAPARTVRWPADEENRCLPP